MAGTNLVKEPRQSVARSKVKPFLISPLVDAPTKLDFNNDFQMGSKWSGRRR